MVLKNVLKAFSVQPLVLTFVSTATGTRAGWGGGPWAATSFADIRNMQSVAMITTLVEVFMLYFNSRSLKAAKNRVNFCIQSPYLQPLAAGMG